MLGSFLKLAIEVAKKVPWWKTLAMAVATTASVTAASKAVDKIMGDGKKTPQQKISELRILKESGEITEEQFEELKKIVLESYAKS